MRPNYFHKFLVDLGIGSCITLIMVYTLSMIDKAKPIKDVFVPYQTPVCDGVTWLYFRYSEDDLNPWQWPKVMKYQDMTFVWSAFNSDDMYVCYKQISEYDLARPVHGVTMKSDASGFTVQPGESRQSIMGGGL